MLQRVYSVSSVYPISSILPLDDAHFAVLLPLDNRIDTYSTTSPFSTSSIQYLTLGDIFVTHNNNQVSTTNPALRNCTLETQSDIVSNCIKVGNRIVNMDVRGVVNVMTMREGGLQQLGEVETGRRRRQDMYNQIPLIEILGDRVGFPSAHSEGFSILNMQRQRVESEVQVGSIQSLISQDDITFIKSDSFVCFFDRRMNKLVTRMCVGESSDCIRVNDNCLCWCSSNTLQEMDLRRGQVRSTRELGATSSTSIGEFQLIGESAVITNTLSKDVEVYTY